MSDNRNASGQTVESGVPEARLSASEDVPGVVLPSAPEVPVALGQRPELPVLPSLESVTPQVLPVGGHEDLLVAALRDSIGGMLVQHQALVQTEVQAQLAQFARMFQIAQTGVQPVLPVVVPVQATQAVELGGSKMDKRGKLGERSQGVASHQVCPRVGQRRKLEVVGSSRTERRQRRQLHTRRQPPFCKKCAKGHFGLCGAHQFACFRCGQVGHFARQCGQVTTVTVQIPAEASLVDVRPAQGQDRVWESSTAEADQADTTARGPNF